MEEVCADGHVRRDIALVHLMGRKRHGDAGRMRMPAGSAFVFLRQEQGLPISRGLCMCTYTLAAPSKAVLMPRGRLLCKLPSVCLHSVSLIVLMATGRQLWKENEDHLEAAASLSLCVLETGLMAVDCRNKLSYSPDGAALVCA